MTPRTAVEDGRTLWTMPIGNVPISNEGNDQVAPVKHTNTSALVAEQKRKREEETGKEFVKMVTDAVAEAMAKHSKPSPSLLAALANDAGRRSGSFDSVLRDIVPGELHPQPLMSREEYVNVLRTRTTVTNATGTGVVAPFSKFTADLPFPAPKVAPLFDVEPVSDDGPVASVSEQTGALPAASAVVDYGTSLVEEALTATRFEPTYSRIGSFVTVTKGAWEDSPKLRDLITNALFRSSARRLDLECLLGDSTGSGAGTRPLGLANLGLSTRAVGGSTRWATIVQAATDVRNANFVGPISVVLNTNDVAKLATEIATGGQPLFADALVALETLDANRVVATSLQTSGTAWVGSFAEAATLYLRTAPSISLSTQHASYFSQGLIAVVMELRAALRLHFAAAITQVTGI